VNFCPHEELCGGCQTTNTSYEEQISLKKREFSKKLESLNFDSQVTLLTLGPHAQRTRTDLTLQQGTLGFYQTNSNKVFSLKTCPHFSKELQNWFNEFSQLQFSTIEKGSLRLRVSPSGQKGLWIDFSNKNIKELLEQKQPLEDLLNECIIEIGQKRKRLIYKDHQLKLSEPTPYPWFQTYIQGTPHLLDGFIGSFTQPSWQSNRLIIDALESLLSTLTPSFAIEWGSGIGNLTLPLATVCQKVLALEIDPLLVLNLKNNVSRSGLLNRVEIIQGDFHHSNNPLFGPLSKAPLSDVDLLVVNPPRSGLKKFVELLTPDAFFPMSLIYLSCNEISLIEDGLQLIQRGYQLKRIYLIDQFPQTTHYESMSLWSRSR
jgi:23S rRNA (uracil1939-C5)-methyltransferase